jgi:hypothetical protein
MRQPNEIDFWRGFALVSIFINHIPGNFYERFTHRNLSLSDSAELFVFLAGWSLRLVTNNAGEHLATVRLVLRLGGRAMTIHGAQILISILALAMLAAAALLSSTPPILEWNNAAAFFQSPAPTIIGIVGLTHQLGYFDILPLYVILMHGSPIAAVVDRYLPRLLLPGAIAIYLGALILEANMPTWPVEGRWFFNPFTWQLIFILGFVLADGTRGPGHWVRQHWQPIWWASLGIVILGAIAVLAHVWPDPTKMPWPRLLYTFNKTYLSPARLIQFLALIVVFAGAFRWLHQQARPVSRYFSMLGRNGLPVFCMASLFSLFGQLVHYFAGVGIVADTFVIGSGVAVLGLTAWVSEWRERLRARQEGVQRASAD